MLENTLIGAEWRNDGKLFGRSSKAMIGGRGNA
jgi:hypothetical protein